MFVPFWLFGLSLIFVSNALAYSSVYSCVSLPAILEAVRLECPKLKNTLAYCASQIESLLPAPQKCGKLNFWLWNRFHKTFYPQFSLDCNKLACFIPRPTILNTCIFPILIKTSVCDVDVASPTSKHDPIKYFCCNSRRLCWPFCC